MVDFLLTTGLVVLYTYPSLHLTKFWFSKRPWWDKISYFSIFFLTVIPLIVFYVNHLLHIPFNLKTLIYILALVNGLVLLLKYPTKNVSPSKTQGIYSYIFLTSTAVALIVFGYSYLFRGQPIIGGDSAHYLYNSSILINQQFSSVVFDRNIIYFFPAIISLITGLSIEIILKWTVTIFEVMSIVVAINLAKNFLKPNLLLPFGLAVIFSPAIFGLSKFVIPFYIGLTIVYLLVNEIINHREDLPKRYYIPLIGGALFNLHGAIAFFSLPVLGAVILYQLITHKIPWQKFLLWIPVFFITSQPLILTQWSRLKAGIVDPIIISLGLIPNANHQSVSLEKQWVDEFTSNQSASPSKFPLYADSFSSSYSLIVVLIALYGLLITHADPVDRKKFLPIGLIFVFQLLLTQQEYLGMRWFPNRFTLSMAVILYIFAFYAIEKICRKIKFKDLSVYIVLAFISLPTILTGIQKHTTLTASIQKEEYAFINDTNQYIQKDDPIFVAAAHGQWFQGVVPHSQVFLTHFDAICNDESSKIRITTQEWEIGQAFSTNVTLEQSLKTFKNYSQDKPYFVYLDAENYHCINGDLFPASHYVQVARKENLYLLKSK